MSEVEEEHIMSLLDLPDVCIHNIATCLEAAERTSFMAACRKAACMSVLTAEEIHLKLSMKARFAGIRKVLDAIPANIHLEISCPQSHVHDVQTSHDKPLYAVALFMGLTPDKYSKQVACSCQWDKITSITIQSTGIRCLMPQFIAASCPQLANLKIDAPTDEHIFTNNPADSLALTLCTSLKQLHVDIVNEAFTLPPTHHSPAELRVNLPNIDTLLLGGHNASIFEAFAAQLTRLELWSSYSDMSAESIRHCSRLQHLHVPDLHLPDNTAALKYLRLDTCTVSDKEIEQLLQLPSLTGLHLDELSHVHHDWQEHACSWERLRVVLLDFTALGNLNLASMTEVTLKDDAMITFPNASHPDSLRKVQQTAANLSHVGKIVIEEDITDEGAWFGDCGTLFFDVPSCSNEQAAAEIVSAAAQCLGPARSCNFGDVLQRPLVLNAALKWGQLFLESVCFGKCYDAPPQVWEALQQLQKLETVVFWPEQPTQYDDNTRTLELFNVSSAVSNAAKHYVIPANRSLRLEFGVMEADIQGAAMRQRLASSGKEFLQAAVQGALPAEARLMSVDYCCMRNCEYYTGYGQNTDSIPACYAEAIWVVVIKPC